MESFDVIVLGGGAAGLFCAALAGQRGRRVLLLEHRERVGLKIAISGGGRCNFTNLHAGPENYLSENPPFCRSALARFSPADFVALVEKHRIRYHEKKLGQLFCDTSSKEIIEMLLAECRAGGVDVRCDHAVQSVEKTHAFSVTTNRGTFEAASLVVATGGLSFPKLGATGIGHRIARQFGLRLISPRPGLVPLAADAEMLALCSSLSGVAVPVRARAGESVFEEAALFTHRGLSGPAILQVSSFWRPGEAIELDFLPDHPKWTASIPGGANVVTELARIRPRRWAESWTQKFAPKKSPAQWTAAERARFSEALHRWCPVFRESEGYPKAEVTVGGVDTRDLSSKTMEARAVRGLFFIGEVVDVTGWLGGYNFQWAWASASACADAV
ncbi:MAG: NAD(P)/FAD-dependent oxidoreductase [Terrimicrobiaceae bacterium]|nr:NAD(P)/FAD-dependent oxidoreductase [Terrimicrobiaceae bacterium]